MKQVTMTFSARELDELALAYIQAVRVRKVHPNDPELRGTVDLLIRLQGAAWGAGGWIEDRVFTIPWVVPVLRKALKDAGALVWAQGEVKKLQVELKLAKAPAPKPKPRPKVKPATSPAPAVTHAAAAP